MMFTQFQTQVKVHRSADVGKYGNNILSCFFCQQGIIHERIIPFTSQQNDVSERRIVVIYLKWLGLCSWICKEVGFQLSLSHAILVACYLINHSLGFRTPFEVYEDISCLNCCRPQTSYLLKYLARHVHVLLIPMNEVSLISLLFSVWCVSKVPYSIQSI